MTEREVQSFLAQFDKAREDFKTWPKWMQEAAVERAATFPKPPADGVLAVDESEQPCPVCGGTERSRAGYLLCECPAASLKPADGVPEFDPSLGDGCEVQAVPKLAGDTDGTRAEGGEDGASRLRFDVLQEIAQTFGLDYNAVCRCANAYLAGVETGRGGEQ